MRFESAERAVEYLEGQVRQLFGEISGLKKENSDLWRKLNYLEEKQNNNVQEVI